MRKVRAPQFCTKPQKYLVEITAEDEGSMDDEGKSHGYKK
jgi:hypothetical protein